MMKRIRLASQIQMQCHRLKHTLFLVAAIFVAACLGTSGLQAESNNATMEVSATVASKCVMQGDTLSFGSYDPASANDTAALNATGNLQIKCTRNTNATISMDAGQYAAQASGTSRAMRSADGENYLSYDLYLDPARSTVWNNVNRAAYTAASGGTPTSISIYGAVPASQDVGDGQYNDVVTITANF